MTNKILNPSEQEEIIDELITMGDTLDNLISNTTWYDGCPKPIVEALNEIRTTRNKLNEILQQVRRDVS